MLTPVRSQIRYYLERITLYNEIPEKRDVIAWLSNLDEIASDLEGHINEMVGNVECDGGIHAPQCECGQLDCPEPTPAA